MGRSNRDHAKKKHRPMIEDKVIAEHLDSLLSPILAAMHQYCRQLGLRNRILTLPVMVAAILTLLWRDVPGVQELTRILTKEGFLWCPPLQVSQQALSQRFLSFPSELFEKLFLELLPQLNASWHARQKRPLPESVQFAQRSFEHIWIADGSVLEALFCKLKSLESVPKGTLAGKMATVLDLVTRLPVEIWFCENPRRSDTVFESKLLERVPPKCLMLLDRGFYHFHFWQQLIDKGVAFITRPKKGISYTIGKVLTESYALRDRIITVGDGSEERPFVTLRLIEIRAKKSWKSYLTSVLDPTILPPYVVADLYRKRWRIEDAFNIVKRLLGLSYLWTGSVNGIKLQIWGTWLFYSILVDLGDAVADEMSLPFDQISLEMLYRGLYHFGVAHQKGVASDPVKYFAAAENQDLGIVKRQRKPMIKLIVAAFPETQRGSPEFFFNASLHSCPTV